MRVALAAALAFLFLSRGSGAPQPALRVLPIYSEDPADPWNRIFAALFTRTVRVSMTDAYPEARPFLDIPLLVSGRIVKTSTRTFERFEDGDRALEALYPSFLTRRGVDVVLTEP